MSALLIGWWLAGGASVVGVALLVVQAYREGVGEDEWVAAMNAAKADKEGQR